MELKKLMDGEQLQGMPAWLARGRAGVWNKNRRLFWSNGQDDGEVKEASGHGL